MRQHLIDAHIDRGEFHTECAKAHEVYAKTLSDGPERDLHTQMCKCHTGAAAKCVARAREASSLDDGIPTGDLRGPKVSKSALATGADRFSNIEDDGVHLVPRFGMDPAEIEKANASGTIPDSVKHIFQRNAGQ
jgi:hypothetical protein